LQEKKAKVTVAEKVVERTQDPLRKQEAMYTLLGAQNEYNKEAWESGYNDAKGQYANACRQADYVDENIGNIDEERLEYLRNKDKFDRSIDTAQSGGYGFTEEEIAQITGDDIDLDEADRRYDEYADELGYTSENGGQFSQRTLHIGSADPEEALLELENIEGIGPATRELLLNHFTSVANIKKAPLQELADLIGAKKAATIQKHFTATP
jgi:hypothetical protein